MTLNDGGSLKTLCLADFLIKWSDSIWQHWACYVLVAALSLLCTDNSVVKIVWQLFFKLSFTLCYISFYTLLKFSWLMLVFFLFFHLNQIKVSCLFPLYDVITDAGFRGREERGWTEGFWRIKKGMRKF